MSVVLAVLRCLPAALLAWLLVDAMASGRIGLNQHLFTRRRHPVGFWLTFALACGMLFLAVAGAVRGRTWWG